MGNRFFETAFTPAVKAEQERHNSLGGYERFAAKGGLVELNSTLSPGEIEFIASRDSFYLGTVSETGWPHVQHRGGPIGFVRILDSRTLGWADFSGNRQYISIGNAAVNARVALFFMDYPNQQRLKVLGHMSVTEIRKRSDLAEALEVNGYEATVEHDVRVQVDAFDWNCSQHILPRFTAAQVEAGIIPLRRQIKELQAQIAKFSGDCLSSRSI